MNSVLPYHSSLTNFKRQNLKKRLLAEIDTAKLFHKVDKIYELAGARIVYLDHELTDVVLRERQPGCHKNPLTLVLRESPPAVEAKQFAATLKTDQRESQLVGEIVGMTLSCSAAVLSWVVIIGSLSAIPISGGISTAITYLGYSAAAASTAQCTNSIVRTGLELTAAQKKDWLDSQEWYQNTSLALDAISLAGVGASAVTVAKVLKSYKGATSRPLVEILKSMPRHERKRMTQEIIRLNHPNVSNSVMKTLIAAGKYPQRYAQSQISSAIALKAKEALSASISFLGSSTTGVSRSIAVGIYEQTIEL